MIFKKAAGQPILQADVSTPDGFSYGVSFKLLHPDAKPVEWVWLCIFYPAKMIFNIGNDYKQLPERERFMQSLLLLGHGDWSSASEINDILDRPITVGGMQLPGKTIRATIGFKTTTSRTIFTTLPLTWFESQFHDSWVAMLMSSVEYLDDYYIDLLKRSFRIMHSLYLEADPASFAAFNNIPAQSFMAATLKK